MTQGMPLLALSDLERLQVVAGVEEHDLGNLREGMEVEAIIAGHPLTGRLSQIGQQPRNDTGQGAWYDVVVDLNLPVVSSELGLRLGMGAQLALLLHHRDHAIALPPEALQRDEAGRTYVVFREGDEQAPRKVPVTVGIAVAQGVEVSGLQAGFVQIP
ncbi:macrolide transporter subunit MacA [compost metagenome]